MSNEPLKRKKYVVAWVEENDYGANDPIVSAGVEVFDSAADADAWIEETIAEDRDRHKDGRLSDEAAFDRCMVGDGVIQTYGNGQRCLYKVKAIEVPDPAAEVVEEIRSMLDRQEPARPSAILKYIERQRDRYMPMHEFSVDVRFSPMVTVRGIVAGSAEDAEVEVWRMIDNRELKVTADQVMGDILENVEKVGNAQREDWP